MAVVKVAGVAGQTPGQISGGVCATDSATLYAPGRSGRTLLRKMRKGRYMYEPEGKHTFVLESAHSMFVISLTRARWPRRRKSLIVTLVF